MLRSASRLLLAAMLIPAQMAFAQSGVGTRLGPPPAEIGYPRGDKAEADRKVMYAYAECIAVRAGTGVRYYVSTFPGSKEASRVASRLTVNQCLVGGQLRFNESVFRGAIYELLYREDFGKEGPTDFSTTPVIDYAAGENGENFRDPKAAVALRELADCVARAGPGAARTLILTPIATPAEQSAFKAVIPHVSGCLAKDTTLGFSRSMLRGVIGETLYRLSARTAEQSNVKGQGDA